MNAIAKCLALAPLAVAITACDPLWHVDARIVVTGAAQAAVTAPAEVVVRIDPGPGGSVAVSPTRIAVVCQLGDDPQELEWQTTRVGCAGESRMLVWIRPLPPGEAPPPCGRVEGGWPASTEPGSFPRGETTVFEGVTRARCDFTDDDALLTIDVE